MTQRGYNIVEAFIVLVVLGLVLGGALVPLQQRFKQEELDTTEELLYAAKQAVQGYALKHRTESGRAVLYYDGLQQDIPAGRPYLPCPDIDYDGQEDRTPLPTIAVAPLSVDIGGGCVETKGLLPWKTLGLRDVDAWGNHFVYRVDGRYASRLLGFDETSKPDLFQPIAQLTTGGRFATVTTQMAAAALVCTEFLTLATPVSRIGCPNENLTNLEAGVVSSVAVTLGARVVPAFATLSPANTGVLEGVVFVILSHGPDGAGAIGRGPVCRAQAYDGNDVVERANAFYRADHFFITSALFNCPAFPAGTAMRENLFVSSRRGPKVFDADVDGPDDMLLWSGRHELLGYLARNGGMPIRKLEVLP